MSLYFTEDHEWIETDGDIGTVGITDYAQGQLGDITYVDLPAVGDEIAKGDAPCAVDSVKAASDVYTPVSGEVIETNEDLEDTPELVNGEPETDGWLFKVKLSDPDELDGLMSAAEYKKYCDGL